MRDTKPAPLDTSVQLEDVPFIDNDDAALEEDLPEVGDLINYVTQDWLSSMMCSYIFCKYSLCYIHVI